MGILGTRNWVAKVFAFSLSLCGCINTKAAGVTLITHGLNGNADGWVQAMANAIADYSLRTEGAALFRLEFYESAGYWHVRSRKLGGGDPLKVPGGEIVVTLDWRQLAAGGKTYNTYQVASVVAPALVAPNTVPELGGHALAELPLHLIGHSRGGSVVCELSRLLGTEGVWVDHVTTLDAHPLNNDGFEDASLYTAIDAPARIYENVLWGDSYYQDSNWFVFGEPVMGAFWRMQTDLTGGYVDFLTGSHSDIHLWYHGTIDLNTPATDSEAWITASERNAWWTESEQYGYNVGFFYSLLGGGDRKSLTQPNGAYSSTVRSGFNQRWDLGAGLVNNRTSLAVNSGEWPNPILLNVTTTNVVHYGDTSTLSVAYQWAQPVTQALTVGVYADDDLNPYNGNERLLESGTTSGTTASQVGQGTIDVIWSPTNALPGTRALFLKLSAAGKARYLYAPEFVEVLPPEPPRLEIHAKSQGGVVVAVNGTAGQTIVLEASTDLAVWESFATNTLNSSRWETSLPPIGIGQKAFIRAMAR